MIGQEKRVLKKLLYVFFISMVPLVELRGAVPVGTGLGIHWLLNLIVCIVGNCIPVPFILLFMNAIMRYMRGCRFSFFSKVAVWLHEKADRNRPKIEKYAVWGLFLFVAIPLPGTGAWTGALAASVFDMSKKKACISIVGGVIAAGVIMTAGSQLVAAVISMF